MYSWDTFELYKGRILCVLLSYRTGNFMCINLTPLPVNLLLMVRYTMDDNMSKNVHDVFLVSFPSD